MLNKMSFEIIHGDARLVVPDLPPVHCVVTSPPYYDKMRYGKSQSEIGHEDGVDAYVAELCDLFCSIPLDPLGSIWVNIGDKRCSRTGGLLGVPAAFQTEMRRRGFLLMDDVIWAKGIVSRDGTIVGNFMTEPAPGRLNGNGWESIFRFSRSRDAWTDMEAVAVHRHNVDDVRYLPKHLMTIETSVEGRRPTNVWSMPLGQTELKHFATFPPDFPERAIAMTCPPHVTDDGVACRRVVEMTEYDEGKRGDRAFGKQGVLSEGEQGEMRDRAGRQDTGRRYVPRKPVTVGWSPDPTEVETWPGVVLDPFAGVGTVGPVALRLGRSFVGIELYDEFADLAAKHCMETVSELRRNHEIYDWTPWSLMR